MSILAIILLLFIGVLLILIIFNVQVSQKAINILLLIIAALVVLSSSGINLTLR